LRMKGFSSMCFLTTSAEVNPAVRKACKDRPFFMPALSTSPVFHT
jgi:hypothetical protein